MQSINTHLLACSLSLNCNWRVERIAFTPRKACVFSKKIPRVGNICWGRQRTWENWTHGNNVGGFCQSPRLLARKQKLAPLSLYHIIYTIYHTSYLLAPKQRRTGPIVTISYNIFIGSQTKEAPLSLYHITYIVYHIYWPPNKNWPHCIVTISYNIYRISYLLAPKQKLAPLHCHYIIPSKLLAPLKKTTKIFLFTMQLDRLNIHCIDPEKKTPKWFSTTNSLKAC